MPRHSPELPLRFLLPCRRWVSAKGLAVLCLAAWLGQGPTLHAQDVSAGGPEPRQDQSAQASPDDAAPPPRPDLIVTASRQPHVALDTPWSVSAIDVDRARSGPDARSLPNLLMREPGVLLQKTGPGQSSPFLRGFTGFRTLWMVDGIRLNNSVWRSGPNQYAGTIDLFAVDRLEVAKGPGAVTWGSDAIGGTIQAITEPADPALGNLGALETRFSSAERSRQDRLEFQRTGRSGWGLKGGVTSKSFGRLHAGGRSGDLPGTSFDERDLDLRLDLPGPSGSKLSFGAQSVRQVDVPRTHKTLDSESFHGTKLGKELFRNLDESRDLLWGRGAWDGEGGGLVDAGSLTLSVQNQREEQRRLRSGGRFDERGFDVVTTGVQLQLENDTPLGLFTWGADAWHDEVSSFRRDATFGSSPLTSAVAGPVADDSSYDLFGLFAQDEIVRGDWETTLGLRATRARARAGAFDNPNVPGSDPATPGNVLSARGSWNDVSASLRSLLHLGDETSVWAGLSQGFRAPNLSDLTSDLVDSGVESPTPDLDPEHFLSLELGLKQQTDTWNAELALYQTWMRDTIVASPTGAFVGGTPVLRKDNVGDGWVHGAELRAERRVGSDWTAFGSLAWLDGEVDQFTPSGNKLRGPIDRLMPVTGLAGVTYEPQEQAWWVQADVLAAARADKLSLRDQADTQRIPPGGTPGFAVMGLRTGVDLEGGLSLGLALENLFDKDYRIHGSGQNEPGRSLVLHGRVQF